MPEKTMQAVLWDLDGVIADTSAYHFQAWQEVFRKRGVEFTLAAFRNHFGQRNDIIIRSALGGGISQEELNTVAGEKEEDYRRRVAANIKSLPGAVELLKSLRRHGIKMAIASSAPLENIQLILWGLCIERFFQAIIWGRAVIEGKPNPQVFLLAAEKLGVAPGNCLVIEDAVAGVAAAKRAGMKCMAVTNSHPRSSLKEADLIVDTLETVSVHNLTALF